MQAPSTARPPQSALRANRALLIVAIVIGVVVLVFGLTAARQRIQLRTRSDVLQSANLSLTPVVKGLKEPTWYAASPDGRFFALERAGTIRLVQNGELAATPVLDLTDRISLDTEEGLLCLVFDPHFSDNGYVYVDYTDKSLAVQIVRYQFMANDPDRLDPASAHTILTLPKQHSAHNGGTLAFGPDGYLYISVGDDEHSENAQDLSNMYGKILRVDLAGGDPYTIPPTNPFVDRQGVAKEIWSYGFRNPWRVGFDAASGDLWIGDVGETDREEVDHQLASSTGGENYGWPKQEGFEWHCDQNTPAPCLAGVTEPILDYTHQMTCAVIGGYVYRGSQAPALVGTYLFGDLCTGQVFAAVKADDQPGGYKRVILSSQPIKISSFAEDPSHELYVVDMQGGVIYHVTGGSLPAA